MASAPEVPSEDKTPGASDNGEEGVSLAIAPFALWQEMELKFSRDTSYSPLLGQLTSTQLERARAEYERRFMQDVGNDSGVPAVLVAYDISSSLLSESLTSSVQGCRFLFDTKLRCLYLVSVPSLFRTAAHSHVNGSVFMWSHRLGLMRLAQTTCATTEQFGTLVCEPDLAIGPPRDLRWDVTDQPSPRVLIQIEYQRRGPTCARRYGYNFLAHSHFNRAFVLIKLYPKDPSTGLFSAIAIVWNKGPLGAPALAPAISPLPVVHANNPVTWPAPANAAELAARLQASAPSSSATANTPSGIGGAVVVSAYDFGTQALSTQAKNAFLSAAAADDRGELLPAVGVFPPHLGVAPAVATEAWQLRVPAQDVLYLLRDHARNIVAVAPGGTNDLTIDLATLQDILASNHC